MMSFSSFAPSRPSGDLTEEEHKKLEAHLAGCAEYRQALQEFQAAIDVGMPLLSTRLATGPSEEPLFAGRKLAESPSSDRVPSEEKQKELVTSAGESKRGFAFAQGNGHGQTKLNGNYVWLPLATCVLLTAALAIHSYWIGRIRNIDASLTLIRVMRKWRPWNNKWPMRP